MKPLLIGDAFCGLGGFSTGVRRALDRRGIAYELVVFNHWPTAIAAHELNHPMARHLLADAYKLSPREAVPGGELDLLMASPTCTFYSGARGGKPVSWDQRWGRMTPTQVLRWLKELNVRALLVENVPEFQRWGPVCQRRTSCKEHGWSGFDPAKPERDICGKPIAKKRGVYFRAWLRRIERLGYAIEWRVLNCADFGDATTRKRFFLQARKDGRPIAWPEPTHSERGESDLLGAGSRRWRPAREIIEWSRRGRSIFRRKHRLARKTLERILAGAERFRWPTIFREALALHLTEESVSHLLCRCESAVEREGGQPVVFQVNQGQDRARNMRGVDEEPLQTVVTRDSLGVATPLVMRSAMHKSNALCVRSSEEPLATATTDGGLALLEPQGPEPFLLNRHGENRPTPLLVEKHGGPWNRARSVDEPMPTATTSGAGYLVEPSPFLLPQGSDAPARSAEMPAPTVVAIPRVGLVEPFVLSQASGGAPRSTEDPVPAIPTEGAHALVAPYHGRSEPRSVEEPLGTVTTRDRFGLVVPVTHADESNRARSVEQPLPAVTTAPRGELAVIVGAFGERDGQAPRVHSIDEPMPTLCAKGRVPLARRCTCGGIDILFRMLEPDELAAAMSFHDEGERYAFPPGATKGDITRLIGNAVPVRTAGALAWSILESLVPRARRRAVVA